MANGIARFGRIIAQAVDVTGGKIIGGQATPTTPGTMLMAATVAPCTVATDGTSAGTQLNALILALRAAGTIV